MTDPTTAQTPASTLQGFTPILLQLFEAFGRGVASVVIDRFFGGKLPIKLPVTLPNLIPTVAPTPTTAPTAQTPSSSLVDLLNSDPNLSTLRSQLETALVNALTQGKVQ